MNIEEYRTYVWGVFKPEIRDSEDAEVYLWGKLVSELAELQQVISFVDLTTRTGVDKLVEEAGDVWWYVVNLSTLYNISIPLDHREESFSYKPLINDLSNVMVMSGIALGEAYKKRYHGKKTDEMQILLQNIIDSMAWWPTRLTIEAMWQNMRKLNERHGTSYNAAFYQQSKKE